MVSRPKKKDYYKCIKQKKAYAYTYNIWSIMTNFGIDSAVRLPLEFA